MSNDARIDEWADEPDPDDYYGPPADADQRQAEIDTSTAEPEPRPTWAPIDLSAILSGNYSPPVPALFPRDDGVNLLYLGLTHSFHGESESGKSLIAQIEAVRLLNAGERVLYIDCESDPVSVVGRLVEFGADPDMISAGLSYVHPEADNRTALELRAWVELLGQRFAMAVIDGVTNALGLFGRESKDNDQVTRWMYQVPDQLARRTGAAVVLIDHVTKDAQTRGRYAIGGQAKLAALTGAAYVVEIDGYPIGRGREGVVMLRLSKDRPGYLRAQLGRYRPSDRTQEAARVVIDSTAKGQTPTVRILAPTEPTDREPGRFRPTVYMERVSKLLEQASAPMSKTAIEQAIHGGAEHIRNALGVLIEEGYVTVQTGARSAQLHSSAKPYRQQDDPTTPLYTPEPELPE